MSKHQCPFCGKISTVDDSKPREKMSVWERDCMMCGICEECYEKTYNVPTKAHEAEWGPIVRYCPNCDCRMYQKDVDKGRCPGCWMPYDEMDEMDQRNEDEYSQYDD